MKDRVIRSNPAAEKHDGFSFKMTRPSGHPPRKNCLIKIQAACLKALPRFEREQLLMGNWNIRPTAGMFFQRSFFEVVKAVPKGGLKAVRYWDRAATKKTEGNDPDYTVGIPLEKDKNNILYVTDMVRIQQSPLGVQSAIKNTASQDGASSGLELNRTLAKRESAKRITSSACCRDTM